MGWEIHITRAEHWADSEQKPISCEEWLSLIQTDSELTFDPRNNGPYFALWLSHELNGEHPWFDWSEGAVNTKHPDRKTLGKALQIAKHFDANVQGDDGERYTQASDFD